MRRIEYGNGTRTRTGAEIVKYECRVKKDELQENGCCLSWIIIVDMEGIRISQMIKYLLSLQTFFCHSFFSCSIQGFFIFVEETVIYISLCLCVCEIQEST